jgi:hypothetical protein
MFDKQSKLNGYFCIGAYLRGNTLGNITPLLFNDPSLVNIFSSKLEQCIALIPRFEPIKYRSYSTVRQYPHAFVIDSKCEPVVSASSKSIYIFKLIGESHTSDDGCIFKTGILVTPVSAFTNRYQILIKERGSSVFRHHTSIIGPNSDRNKVERELRAAVRERNKKL